MENLKDILEDVAIRLQEGKAPHLYLRDYRGKGGEKIAELLWRMRDQAVPRDAFGLSAQDDAANRVGIRSLLKAVPAPRPDYWPVDFFHRSMREFFAARAIVHCLTDDPQRARHILSRTPLLPEIAHFAATILRERPSASAVANLDALVRSAAIDGDGEYLGGSALTLLNAVSDNVAGRDWSNLRLDHARLRGADLRGARFAGSSLRYANLDNANLEGADLTGADLEGVRLEETSQVLAITAMGGNRIIAAYEDRSLREWRGHPGAGWESRVLTTLGHKAYRLQVTPLGRVIATGDGRLSVLDSLTALDGASGTGGPGPAGPGVQCEFQTSSRCRAAIVGVRSALFTEEGDGGHIRLSWVDMATAQALDELEVHSTVTACAQLDGRLYVLAVPGAIHAVWPGPRGQRRELSIADPAVTCLAVRADGDGFLLAAGHNDGSVAVTRGSLADDIEVELLWRRQLHDGPVTDVLLDADEQVITGSTDRSVCLTPVPASRPGQPEPPVQRLHLTPRCKNVRFENVRTERERDKLRQYAGS